MTVLVCIMALMAAIGCSVAAMFYIRYSRATALLLALAANIFAMCSFVAALLVRQAAL